MSTGNSFQTELPTIYVASAHLLASGESMAEVTPGVAVQRPDS